MINFFPTFKFRCRSDFEMANGDFVNGIFSDRTLKKLFEKMFLENYKRKNLFKSIK